ncbi:MAG TPA: nicotinamide riboside transporter PnuC [Gemmatimonadaceae bacterium]|nr:nicotinamide riboside transporter PnuC [Gemmatimonadaceae bacterium]
MTMLEVIAAVFGAIAVSLSARENVWSWPTAIVNVALYTIVFFQSRLYADMGLQVVYLVLSVYGWYNWLHGGVQRTELHVSRATLRTLLITTVFVVVGSYILGSLLATRTNAALPYLDSALTVASLAAQWMMTRKILENWIIWIVLDVIYVPMFLSRGLFATSVLYAIFLVLAILGLITWRRSYLRQQPSSALKAA